MKHAITRDGGRLLLQLSGQLTATDRDAFSAIIDEMPSSGVSEIEVGLAQLRYIDSVGLGLLVTLREKASVIGAHVALVGAVDEVRGTFEMACFDRLFTIR